MNESEINKAIATRVGNSKHPDGRDPKMWRVGITNNLADSKKRHECEGRSIANWKDWNADSKKVAEDVERYWIHEKGMNGGTGGNVDGSKPVYVYIL